MADGGLLGGIIPMITNAVPILGMITGDDQGNQGGGIGDIFGGNASGGGGILGMLGGSSGGRNGASGLIGGVLDLLGVTDILGGFGLTDGTKGSARNDGQAFGTGANSIAADKAADSKDMALAKGNILNALLGSMGGGAEAGDDAQLAAAALAGAGAGLPSAGGSAAHPGWVSTSQPLAQAGTPVGGMLPSELSIPVIPM